MRGPSEVRERLGGRLVICLLLALIMASSAAGGCGPRVRRASEEVWNAPELEVEPGGALAAAQAFLDAACKGDWETVDALYLAPRPGRVEGFSTLFDETGTWARYRLVSSESGTDPAGWPNFPGGPALYVYTVVATDKTGDLEVGVGLAREGGTGRWGLCFFSWDPVAASGSVGPPSFDLPAESLVPLASSDQRAKALAEYEDVALQAALVWEKDRGALPIVISPKVELAFVVAGLTGEAPEFCALEGSYWAPMRRKALRYFAGNRDHPAVAYMSFLERQGFRYDAVGGLALRFSDPPGLEPAFPIGDYLVGRSYGWDRDDQERRLLEAVELMRQFAVEADFAGYMQATRDDYAELLESARANIPPGLPDTLEDYFGTRNDAYVVIVSGLSGSYGPSIVDGDWTCLLAIVTFAPQNASSVWTAVAHEWSHSFVNPVVAEQSELVQSYSGLFNDRMRAAMGQQAYGTWETTLNEHIIRAVMARTIGRDDPALAERALANDEQRGFLYIRALYNRLAEYEADRNRYPTFASFLPRLLEALGAPAKTGP